MTSLVSRSSALVERVGKQSWRVRGDTTDGPPRIVEAVRLDRSSWRVSDLSIVEGEPSRLLGYVERLDRDRFEVLWLAASVTWAYVASFDEALAAVADRDHFGGSVETHRDPSIEAPPVPRFHRIRRRKGGE